MTITLSGCARISTCLAVVVLLAGCHRGFDPVPGRVTPEEMYIYETWLREHKQNSPKTVIEVELLTSPIPLNDIAPNAYEDALNAYRAGLQRDGISANAITRLADLGDARYPLSPFSDFNLAVFRNEDRTISVPCEDAEVAFIHFSRIAFSRDRKMALFHVMDVHCSHGSIGGGGGSYLFATKTRNGWSFKSIGSKELI